MSPGGARNIRVLALAGAIGGRVVQDLPGGRHRTGGAGVEPGPDRPDHNLGFGRTAASAKELLVMSVNMDYGRKRLSSTAKRQCDRARPRPWCRRPALAAAVRRRAAVPAG